MAIDLSKKLDDLKIGQTLDVKIGLSTRQIERVSKTKYVINDFVDGWQQAKVDRLTLDGVISGKFSLLELEWY